LPKGITFANGQDLTCKCFLLALNHSIDNVRNIPEEFVVFGEYHIPHANGTRLERVELGRVSLSEFDDTDGYASFECMFSWPTGQEPHKIQVFYRSTDPSDNPQAVAATPLLPFEFWLAAWNPDSPSAEQIQKDAKDGKLWVDRPVSSPGRWHLAHPFATIDDIAVIYLWRYEAPAFFEMHSHIEGNHCSPLPPAWIHAWDATVEVHELEPGYKLQDNLLSLPILGKGEMAQISTKSTDKIASQFCNDFGEGEYGSVFPFLAKDADQVACLMPMDMEYMHFNGYFGIPISQVVRSMESETGITKDVRWYCWDKIWEFATNNDPYSINVPKYTGSPRSVREEVWSWMELANKNRYEDWSKQFATYSGLFKRSNGSARYLPLFHFDPRRYLQVDWPYTTIDPMHRSTDIPETLDQVLSQSVQSQWNTGTASFFGFKLYTSLGWAPMDPFLKDPLQRFYAECERDRIPLLNHCTPGGYYTHDRRHYFDLLQDLKMVTPGQDDDLDEEGWISRFSDRVLGPDGKGFSPNPAKDDNWASHHEEDRVWWFVHHYVSPRSWKKVLAMFPKLKLCLAHLGDSDHFSDDAWGKRKMREPHLKTHDQINPRTQLTIAFDGDSLDPARTHRFLYDLINLVQPSNNVFVDLSYVILDQHNAAKVTELFHWAQLHKPILLERILWGTDWPLVGDEPPVKNPNTILRVLKGENLKKGNMLRRYARAFREAAPDLPHDFFLRACFLNPLQYLDLRRIRSLLGADSGWDWVQDLDERLFDVDCTLDKTEILYSNHKSLAFPVGV
jgi:hypothetical protein